MVSGLRKDICSVNQQNLRRSIMIFVSDDFQSTLRNSVESHTVVTSKFDDDFVSHQLHLTMTIFLLLNLCDGFVTDYITCRRAHRN